MRCSESLLEVNEDRENYVHLSDAFDLSPAFFKLDRRLSVDGALAGLGMRGGERNMPTEGGIGDSYSRRISR